MKLKQYILTGVISLSFGIIVRYPFEVSAKTYTTVPKSLRGNWYSYDSTNGYSKLHATKYKFSADGTTFYGNKFPKYARGHSQMFVYKTKKGYYNIGKYASDEWPYWKKVKRYGHPALREVSYWGDVYYWYKSKSIAKHPKPTPKALKGYKIADNTDFFYNSWRAAYLDMYTDEADLYKNFNDAKYALDEPDYKLTNYKKKVYAKWPSADSPYDIILVKVDGKTYYLNDSLHDIRPYNASINGKDGIFSKFKPTDKNIILKHGTKVYKNTEWYYETKGINYINTGKNYHSWKKY